MNRWTTANNPQPLHWSYLSLTYAVAWYYILNFYLNFVLWCYQLSSTFTVSAGDGGKGVTPSHGKKAFVFQGVWFMCHAHGLLLELASKPTAYLIMGSCMAYWHVQVLNLFNA